MGRARTTIDIFEMHTNYGHGWECECVEYSIHAYFEQVRTYKANCPGIQIKRVRKREPKSNYTPSQLAEIQRIINAAKQRWRDRAMKKLKDGMTKVKNDRNQ